LEKPEALGGRAPTAANTVQRARLDLRARSRELGPGRIDTVVETQEARLESVTLAPGASFDSAGSECPRAIAWLSSGNLSLDGARRVEVGAQLLLGSRLVAGPEGATMFRCALRA
jgi:hypothetical protein